MNEAGRLLPAFQIKVFLPFPGSMNDPASYLSSLKYP